MSEKYSVFKDKVEDLVITRAHLEEYFANLFLNSKAVRTGQRPYSDTQVEVASNAFAMAFAREFKMYRRTKKNSGGRLDSALNAAGKAGSDALNGIGVYTLTADPEVIEAHKKRKLE